MIHEIEALHNEGVGHFPYSARKYLRMDEVAIGERQSRRARCRQLDIGTTSSPCWGNSLISAR